MSHLMWFGTVRLRNWPAKSESNLKNMGMQLTCARIYHVQVSEDILHTSPTSVTQLASRTDPSLYETCRWASTNDMSSASVTDFLQSSLIFISFRRLKYAIHNGRRHLSAENSRHFEYKDVWCLKFTALSPWYHPVWTIILFHSFV